MCLGTFPQWMPRNATAVSLEQNKIENFDGMPYLPNLEVLILSHNAFSKVGYVFVILGINPRVELARNKRQVYSDLWIVKGLLDEDRMVCHMICGW